MKFGVVCSMYVNKISIIFDQSLIVYKDFVNGVICDYFGV